MLEDRCQKIELLVSDVDGVLTDGQLVFDNQGIESKRFHAHDGTGIKLWRRAGGKFGIVTSRSSHIVEVRAGELGIDYLRQGIEQKLPALREMMTELGLTPEQVGYIGDDLPDLAAVQFAGLGVAVADACPELRRMAEFVTESPGGHGAVRETIEMILKAQRRWDDLIRTFSA